MYARKKGLKTSSGENTLAGNEFQERSFRTCSTASCGYFENVQGDENRCVDKKKRPSRYSRSARRRSGITARSSS